MDRRFDELSAGQSLRGQRQAVSAVLVLWKAREAARTCPDRCDQRLGANDIHDAREIVGEDVQRHLAGDAWQRFHQEMRRAHARPDRAEGMLDGLAPLTHGLWVLIEPALHGLKHVGDPIDRMGTMGAIWVSPKQLHEF
jgi:hypothetical protein